ncbi:hypothetical protein HN011_004060, partial [Eciton burchellii]
MTRKCALCKETNYKNNYSFFSAPKDAETRKKWQVALAIKNYTVTDDTYVCSKHFHKSDIITHWISGVPPQVVKVKYKKCRLRPGAVPGRNSCSVSNSQSVDKDDITMNDFLIFKKRREKNKTFLISRKKILNDDKDIKKNTNMYYQTYSKSQNSMYNCEGDHDFDNIQSNNINTNERNIDITSNLKLENPGSKKRKLDVTLEYDNISNSDYIITESIDIDKEKKDKSQISDESSHVKISNNIQSYVSSENDETPVRTYEYDIFINPYVHKRSIGNNLKTDNNLCIKNQMLTILDDHLNMQNKSICDKDCKNDILFEDFLEVCTELSIPHGWSCLITSKGHNTTVVYLYMNITKDGLPFVEKQIFIKSDMVLHYSVANREIDPVMHNLIKKRRHNKIISLLDTEILIAEFDQRAICQGICDSRDYRSIDMIKIAYVDGIKWRHVSCPLIINNDNSRC